MANRIVRGLDADEVLRRIMDDDDFSDSGDDSSDDDDNLEEIIRAVNVIELVDMTQSPRDQEIQSDVNSGWGKTDSPPLLMPFTGNSGLTCELPDSPTPLDLFNILFDESMWTHLVEQTNTYAANKITTQQLKPQVRLHKWKPVTVDELKVFFALVISMGMTRKFDIEMYWSTEECLSTPFFGKHMSKNRFLLLLSNLHVADNSTAVPAGEPGYDRLHKVRPFIRMIRENFLKYEPEMNLSFDEGTCPFKGRVQFRVYNPMKPNKFGIKLYQVCESSSGYCVGFDVYDGQTECASYVHALVPDDENGQLADVYSDLTQTSKIVIGMLGQCGLLSKGHHVYMDNYYTSPELFTELNLLDTYACGTLRINRKGTPKVLSVVKKLKQGESIYRRNENMLSMKFHDKRDVHMLTTIHEAKLGVTDRIDRRTNEPILKPIAIIDYIKQMGGVDLSDQIVQYYDVLRKSVKWWKKLFFHLFNLMMVNAYALYRKYGERLKKRTHREFRLQLVKSLLESAPDAPAPSAGRRKSEDIGRLTGRHFPAKIQPKEGAKRLNPIRDCIVCNVEKKKRTGHKRKQTSMECKQCEKPMCVPDCFARYHTHNKYKSPCK